MKAIVNCNLNIRTGKPSVNAPNPGFYKKGYEIKIDDVTTGDNYDGNNIWYKLSNGSFVWSGEVERVKEMLFASPKKILLNNESNAYDWWHKEYKIAEIWDRYKIQGEGVKIAILDSGIDANHPYFNKKYISGYNFYDSSNIYEDNNGHGTQVASIICSNGPELIGVAPKACIYAAKIFNYGKVDVYNLIETIKKLPKDIDIVVLSQSFLKQDFNLNNLKYFDNRLFICSPGNDNNHFDEPIDRRPSSFKNTIAVSACGQNGEIYSRSTKSNFITLCGPGENLKTLNTFNHKQCVIDSGTSFSVPFVAGVLALMKSYCNHKSKNTTVFELIDIIKSTLDKTNKPLLFGDGIINPLKAFSEL